MKNSKKLSLAIYATYFMIIIFGIMSQSRNLLFIGLIGIIITFIIESSGGLKYLNKRWKEQSLQQ